MTINEKKQFLLRYTQLNCAINQKLLELEQTRSLCEKVTASVTGMPHGGGGAKEDAYIKLVLLSRELNSEIDRYVDMRAEIEAAIGSVTDATAQTILRYRYINGMTWEEVAEEMAYCTMQLHRLHRKALEELVV